MDRFIKNVPFIVGVGLLGLALQSGDTQHSNAVIAFVCASVVFMFTAIVYILMHHYNKKMMEARYYIFVMIVAGLLAFTVLYTSLEYFYS